jgi:CheY-like chemotaxis protein
MSYTLLLADDSVTIQRVIELTFASEDISVVAFSDGQHAIASLDRTPPDIVLADIGMPGRSGYELSRYIKRTPALAHIPVLLLTGAFEPVDQAKAIEAGCDGILIKPFEPQLVISRVKELLRKPKPGTKDAEVESYFDELDRSFANLAAAPPLPVPTTDMPAVHPPETNDTKDAVSSPPVLSSPAVPPPRPSLAEAFAALLAAERSDSNGAERRLSPMPAPERPLVPSDELIERVARRVLEHLSDAVVRETIADIIHTTAAGLVRQEAVTDIVHTTAERLVREEMVTDIVRAAADRLVREEMVRDIVHTTAERLVREEMGTDVVRTTAERLIREEMLTDVVRTTAAGLVREEMVTDVVRTTAAGLVREETVTDIIHATAERLVREEIDRIKSNIK